MSQHFNSARFNALLKTEWAQNKRLFLFWTLMLFVLFISIIVVQLYWNEGKPASFESFSVMSAMMLPLVSLGLASSAFQKLKNTETAVFELTLPATTLEKFLVVLFKHLVVINFTVIVCYLTVNGLYQLLLLKSSGTSYQVFYPKNQTERLVGFFVIFIAAQSVYVFGSLTFKKNAQLFTTLILFGCLFILAWYIGQISKLFGIGVWFLGRSDFETTQFYLRQYQMDGAIKNNFAITLLRVIGIYIWAPLFYVATYFKLKEIQLK